MQDMVNKGQHKVNIDALIQIKIRLRLTRYIAALTGSLVENCQNKMAQIGPNLFDQINQPPLICRPIEHFWQLH